MDFAFNDEQREIQAAAQRLMADRAKFDRVIELAQTADGFDRADYAEIAQLGWTGMQIPEQFGGAGLSHVELVVVLEQMGKALYPSPFFASVCLAANALIEGAAGAEISAENSALLGAIASGERTATLAYVEPGGRYRPSDVALSARSDGGDWLLDGKKTYVVDGHTADAIIVVARTGAGDGEIAMFAVDGDAPGLSRKAIHAVDQTRKLAALEFDGVRVPASAAVGEMGNAWPTLNSTMQLAAVALSAESLGAAQHCFDTALTYTKERFQFGRPIGSFQAIKHICADLLMAVEQSRSAVYYAGWVASEQREELPVVGPLAKAHVHDAFWEVARMNIQLHGGIGFTYEHEAHRYYRRATASRAMLGDGDFNREMLLQGLGLVSPKT